MSIDVNITVYSVKVVMFKSKKVIFYVILLVWVAMLTLSGAY